MTDRGAKPTKRGTNHNSLAALATRHSQRRDLTRMVLEAALTRMANAETTVIRVAAAG